MQLRDEHSLKSVKSNNLEEDIWNGNMFAILKDCTPELFLDVTWIIRQVIVRSPVSLFPLQ